MSGIYRSAADQYCSPFQTFQSFNRCAMFKTFNTIFVQESDGVGTWPKFFLV